MPACSPVTPEPLVMLHKLSLLMTGLVLVMGVAWFGIERLSANAPAAAATPEQNSN